LDTFKGRVMRSVTFGLGVCASKSMAK